MTEKEHKLKIAMIKADLKIVHSLCESANKAEKALAAYHVQQAIEKTLRLKAELLGVSLWGHDVTALIHACKINGIYRAMNIPKGIEDNAAIYSSWEAKCRYDVHAVVRKDSIWKAYRLCIEWLNRL